MTVPPTAPAVVAAERLSVGYEGAVVVSGLDLRVLPGDLFALIGTNGSGKSTLLKTVVALIEPIDGSLQVFGEPPGRSPARVAYVSQFHHDDLVLPLRVRDVVATGRYASRGLFGRFTPDDRDLVDDAMGRVGVTDLASRPVTQLSGGQRQRVHLAQALAHHAHLLVLDEPTAGLDVAARETYEQVIADERARGAAVLVATHDIGETEHADEVLLLAGRVVAQGPPHQVLTAENLLEAFGVNLRPVGASVLAGEQPHAHAPKPQSSAGRYPGGYPGKR